MIVRFAELDDLKYVEHLRKKETNSLGFLPIMAFESAITGKKTSSNRWSTTCNDKLWVIEENLSKNQFSYIIV